MGRRILREGSERCWAWKPSRTLFSIWLTPGPPTGAAVMWRRPECLFLLKSEAGSMRWAPAPPLILPLSLPPPPSTLYPGNSLQRGVVYVECPSPPLDDWWTGIWAPMKMLLHLPGSTNQAQFCYALLAVRQSALMLHMVIFLCVNLAFLIFVQQSHGQRNWSKHSDH